MIIKDNFYSVILLDTKWHANKSSGRLKPNKFNVTFLTKEKMQLLATNKFYMDLCSVSSCSKCVNLTKHKLLLKTQE